MSDAPEQTTAEEDGAVTEPMKEFFVFTIDDELYAVPALDVDQVLRIPPITGVPNASDAVVGIFHLRGRVIVAIDIMRCLGLPRAHMLSSFYLFTTHREKNHYAILIDEPRTLARVGLSSIRPPDPLVVAHITHDYVSGVFLYENAALSKKRERSFLIEPVNTPSEPSRSEKPKKSVVILDLARILTEENVTAPLDIGPARETPPAGANPQASSSPLE